MVLLKLANNLRNFNINHVTKIPYYTQSKAIIKHHLILNGKFLKIKEEGKKLYPLVLPHVILHLVTLAFTFSL